MSPLQGESPACSSCDQQEYYIESLNNLALFKVICYFPTGKSTTCVVLKQIQDIEKLII